ncbi:hypothetical protein [Pseudoalteromonas sp. PPB1]|uniref:hypothetical protein n=1 Tax=Pseudoalteromonas sp. PPB1 TaxID=2756136 RepID=UPI0018914B48|nr:hypothetical protein [Pseudoalteromonas sp. PPB1]
MTDKAIQVGDHTVSVALSMARNKMLVPKVGVLPEPQAVDIQQAMSELSMALGELRTLQPRKLNNALEEAKEEIEMAHPDKTEAAESLARAAKIAKEAENFANHNEILVERFTPVLGWLGPHATRVAEALSLITYIEKLNELEQE